MSEERQFKPDTARPLVISPKCDAYKVLDAYGALHDRLSEMIEEGRLEHDAIPHDYVWLVEELEKLSSFWL